MSELHESAATLRFFGDDLNPDELTALLGAPPSVGVVKGGVWRISRGVEKVARRGSWRLKAKQCRPGDLDKQIAELLAPLTQSLEVWQDLIRRYEADIFCGLFLKEGNEGLELSPATLVAVGSRGLVINFDIYGQEMSDVGDVSQGPDMTE